MSKNNTLEVFMPTNRQEVGDDGYSYACKLYYFPNTSLKPCQTFCHIIVKESTI